MNFLSIICTTLSLGFDEINDFLFILFIYVRHNNTKQAYYMNGHQLERTEVERDIGVSVAQNLKQADQCKKAARTAQTVLSQLTRAFHFRDRHVFVRLYAQYVRPHLEFAVPAWSPWQEGDKEVLKKGRKEQ